MCPLFFVLGRAARTTRALFGWFGGEGLNFPANSQLHTLSPLKRKKKKEKKTSHPELYSS
jgi:hypothetical protein